MKDIIKIVLVLFVIVCIVSVVRPYWVRRGLANELKTASIYATKNSIKDTKKFLDKKMMDGNYGFEGEEFTIEKNKDNSVSISITYIDEISIFGLTLKELEFTVEKSSSEVKALW